MNDNLMALIKGVAETTSSLNQARDVSIVERDRFLMKGGGWSSIPGGKKGGQRRKGKNGKWEYTYGSVGAAADAAHHHAKEAQEAKSAGDHETQDEHEDHQSGALKFISDNISDKMKNHHARMAHMSAKSARESWSKEATSAHGEGSRESNTDEGNDHNENANWHAREGGFKHHGDLANHQRKMGLLGERPKAKPKAKPTKPSRGSMIYALNHPEGRQIIDNIEDMEASYDGKNRNASKLARAKKELKKVTGYTWKSLTPGDLMKGGGWSPIPGGKKGGQRRRAKNGKWEYQYSAKDQVGLNMGEAKHTLTDKKKLPKVTMGGKKLPHVDTGDGKASPKQVGRAARGKAEATMKQQAKPTDFSNTKNQNFYAHDDASQKHLDEHGHVEHFGMDRHEGGEASDEGWHTTKDGTTLHASREHGSPEVHVAAIDGPGAKYGKAMKKSGDERDVLSLITERPSQEGTFTLGSITFDDNGAYQRPQTIQRHGLVRRAEPPVFNTGHDPHLVSFPKYEDGRVVEMPGLPEPHGRVLPVIKDKE